MSLFILYFPESHAELLAYSKTYHHYAGISLECIDPLPEPLEGVTYFCRISRSQNEMCKDHDCGDWYYVTTLIRKSDHEIHFKFWKKIGPPPTQWLHRNSTANLDQITKAIFFSLRILPIQPPNLSTLERVIFPKLSKFKTTLRHEDFLYSILLVEASNLIKIDSHSNIDLTQKGKHFLLTLESDTLFKKWYSNAVEDIREDIDEIILTADFPPQHQRAGVIVLSYIKNIIDTKHPTAKVKCSLVESGTSIFLRIEFAKGFLDEIHYTLFQYSKVIKGELRPEDFLESESSIIELRYELRNAKNMVDSYREIIEFQRKRLLSQEEQIIWFQAYVANVVSHSQNEFESLRVIQSQALEIFRDQNDEIKNAIVALINELEIQNSPEARSKLESQLLDLKRENPSGYQQLVTYFKEVTLKGMVPGTSAAILFEILKKLLF